MARQIASSWEGRVARRLREKVEMLFAHLKRILKLGGNTNFEGGCGKPLPPSSGKRLLWLP